MEQGAGRERLKRTHRRTRTWARWVGRNWARWTYGRRIEPTWLELTRQTVPIRGLSQPFHGFRIVHLSDFHAGRHVTLPYLLEAVELANRQSPDLIAVTGDFIHKGYRHIEAAAEAMSRLTAKAGVYAVLGNHDFSVRNALGLPRYRRLHLAVSDALGARGVTVLRNSSVRLERDGSPLHLVGIDDLWSRRCDPAAAFGSISGEHPRIVLAHNPQTIHHLDEWRCDLMLSGHTHGGQVDWPGVGRVFLSRKGRRFAAGLYRHQHSYLYVHRGVGHGLPFRFGVRPEVAVIDLESA